MYFSKHSKQTQHSQCSIWGVTKEIEQKKWFDAVQKYNTTQQTVGGIGEGGAHELSEALKTNTTLTSLILDSEDQDKAKGAM